MLFALRWVRRVVSAVVLLVVLVVGGTAASIWWTARQDDHPTSDVIIVLGAAQFDGEPSSVFKARLQHARALYEQGVAPRVITVGAGAPGDRTTEADAGAAFLTERGRPRPTSTTGCWAAAARPARARCRGPVTTGRATSRVQGA